MYVKNLPSDWTYDILLKIFGEYGQIERAKVVGGGIAFVDYMEHENALHAIAHFDKQMVAPGHKLEVRFATKQKGKKAHDRTHSNNQHNLYVGHLPECYDQSCLETLFSNYGKILCSRIKGNGVALVRFEEKEDDQRAIQGLHCQKPPRFEEEIVVKLAHFDIKDVDHKMLKNVTDDSDHRQKDNVRMDASQNNRNMMKANSYQNGYFDNGRMRINQLERMVMSQKNKIQELEMAYYKLQNENNQWMLQFKEMEIKQKNLEEANNALNKKLESLRDYTQNIDVLSVDELDALRVKLKDKLDHIDNAKEVLLEIETECIICMDNAKNIVINGCNHCVICDRCETNLQPKICPLCRNPYESITNLNK